MVGNTPYSVVIDAEPIDTQMMLKGSGRTTKRFSEEALAPSCKALKAAQYMMRECCSYCSGWYCSVDRRLGRQVRLAGILLDLADLGVLPGIWDHEDHWSLCCSVTASR
jgi:hypothetical protein